MDDRPSVPVSVVIPCFRCAQTVERAVLSIAQQTLLPAEVLLIEDGSNDEGETLDCLYRVQTRYGNQLDVKIIRLNKNSGPSVARNAGWEAAKSPYIAFLDADDAWHPRKLEIQVVWMEAHSEVAMTGTLTTVVGQLHNQPALPESYRVKEITFNRMLLRNVLPTRSVVIRAGVPHRFVPDKRYGEDYFLLISAIADGHRAFLVELPLAYSFKRDFGVAGLSSHLWAFHCEVLDTYRRLHQAGHIGVAMRIMLVTYELAKYFPRLVLSRRPEVPQHS